MEHSELKEEVKGFWEKAPCGSWHGKSEKYSKDYFDEIEQKRYQLEPFIHEFARFKDFKEKKVLEIGVGAGTDHIQFARAGAELYGVDLTESAIEMVRHRLELEGLSSRIACSDAEELPFEDDFFDYVYSWGVLHHSPDTQKTIREVYRVCKPGGKICIMLYNRHSLLAARLWFLKGPLKLRPLRTFKDVIFNHMESHGTKAYTVKELYRMFRDFTDVRITTVITPYDLLFVPKFLRHVLPSALGWFHVIRASKK